MARGVRPGMGPRNWDQLVESGYLDQIANLFIPGRNNAAIERILRERYPALHHSTIAKAIRKGREIMAANRAIERGNRTVTPPSAETADTPLQPRYNYTVVVGTTQGRNILTVLQTASPLTRQQVYAAARQQAQITLDRMAQQSPRRHRPGTQLTDQIWILSAFAY